MHTAIKDGVSPALRAVPREHLLEEVSLECPATAGSGPWNPLRARLTQAPHPTPLRVRGLRRAACALNFSTAQLQLRC